MVGLLRIYCFLALSSLLPASFGLCSEGLLKLGVTELGDINYISTSFLLARSSI